VVLGIGLGLESSDHCLDWGGAGDDEAVARPVPLARKGLLVDLDNPKMVIFYLAFFPQFIHPA
jgi:threonine/homoserine/homoserine lactone efflux protein